MENKYVCPNVEVLEVAIEKGFAATGGTGGSIEGGGGMDED